MTFVKPVTLLVSAAALFALSACNPAKDAAAPADTAAKSHISAVLTTLEERGWVSREPDPADARAKRLFLTPAGELAARRTAAIQAEVAATMADAVSPRALTEVTAAMLRISQRLQATLQQTD